MNTSNNILSLINQTPNTIIKEISERVKERRLEMALTQKELALRAGIPLPTYRRFERSGEIALRSLVMLGLVLGTTEEFSTLFSVKTYKNLDDLLKQKNNKRKRGNKNG